MRLFGNIIRTYKDSYDTYNFIIDLPRFDFRIALWSVRGETNYPFYYCNYGKKYPELCEEGEKHSVQFGAFYIMINFSWECYI